MYCMWLYCVIEFVNVNVDRRRGWENLGKRFCKNRKKSIYMRMDDSANMNYDIFVKVKWMDSTLFRFLAKNVSDTRKLKRWNLRMVGFCKTIQ